MIASLLPKTIASLLVTASIVMPLPLVTISTSGLVTSQGQPEMHYVVNDAQNALLKTNNHVKEADTAYYTSLFSVNSWINNPVSLKTAEKDSDKNTARTDTTTSKKQSGEVAGISVQQPTVAPKAPIVPAGPSNYDAVYQAAGAKFGVPWQILYGIHMTETGGRNGAISSGHGPQGPMQFMPGTWSAYGVDGDGDGVANINDATDAIYGAANFIARHGSVEAGLRAYGGNHAGVLRLAQAKGY